MLLNPTVARTTIDKAVSKVESTRVSRPAMDSDARLPYWKPFSEPTPMDERFSLYTRDYESRNEQSLKEPE